MAGKDHEKILDELFDFAKSIMQRDKIYPYVAFVVKNGVIISKGYNNERKTKDVTAQGDVVAIRSAQESLETNDLSGYTLYSFFEPTILGFDVALWAGIRDFVWCINSTSLPKFYHNLNYRPTDYMEQKGGITILNGERESEALIFAKTAKHKDLYPDNLY